MAAHVEVDTVPRLPRRPDVPSIETDSGVGELRRRLGLGWEIDDETIVASLGDIRRAGDPLQQLQAAFDSTLGHWLALSRADLADAMAILIGAAGAKSY